MIRVVFDTNIYVSALIIPGGIPAQILHHLHNFEAITSEAILVEVMQALHYEHIQKRFKGKVSADKIQGYIERLRAFCRIITVTTKVDVIHEDPDDNDILACAVDGEADHIVTGDKDLLALGTYQGVIIVSPAEFLQILQHEHGEST